MGRMPEIRRYRNVKRTTLAVAASALAAVSATPALAAHHHRLAVVKHKRPAALQRARVFAARAGHLVFVGNLTAAPAAGATSLTVTVTGGDREALRKMLGQSTTQTFAVGPETKVQKVGSGSGQLTDLAQGDVVWIEVKAAKDATLADVEKTAATRVVDRAKGTQTTRTVSYSFVG